MRTIVFTFDKYNQGLSPHGNQDENGGNQQITVAKAPHVLHQSEELRMIGKYFSNGWKIRVGFSNDWEKLWVVFQRLEKCFGGGNRSDNYDNF